MGTPAGRIADDDAVLVFNYGDPSYRAIADATPGLTTAEEIFLRLVASLVFADSVCIPARHIFRGRPMAQAIRWTAPLLKEGVIRPARRRTIASFEDYALEQRQSTEPAAIDRGRFLDCAARRPYLFDDQDMAAMNKAVLDGDLQDDGAFRRAVVGGRFGRYAGPLSLAGAEHARRADGSIERFVDIVAGQAPDLRHQARRWALARYYTTPVLYGVDTVNTREIPSSAAALLARGGVLVTSPGAVSRIAPAEMAYSRLRAAIPAIPVSRNAEDYCIALLAVREAFPQARTVFSGLRDAREVREAEAALADRFDRELSRQVRSRPSKGRIFTLASSLIGGVGGGALGLVMGADPTVGAASGLAFGMVSGIASNEIQNAVSRRAGLRRRPWLLAVDRLEQMMAERAADNPPRLR